LVVVTEFLIKMKKLIVLASLLFATPVFATPGRPFRYETGCGIETRQEVVEDTCVVIETREKSGALRTRNIFSNRFMLTVKGRFDKENGYMTWDSHNNYEYKWEYKVAGSGWTYVMPGFMVENISWD
jgi:hypothetical protein